MALKVERYSALQTLYLQPCVAWSREYVLRLLLVLNSGCLRPGFYCFAESEERWCDWNEFAVIQLTSSGGWTNASSLSTRLTEAMPALAIHALLKTSSERWQVERGWKFTDYLALNVHVPLWFQLQLRKRITTVRSAESVATWVILVNNVRWWKWKSSSYVLNFSQLKIREIDFWHSRTEPFNSSYCLSKSELQFNESTTMETAKDSTVKQSFNLS